jgi:diaminopimelate decarboxylase
MLVALVVSLAVLVCFVHSFQFSRSLSGHSRQALATPLKMSTKEREVSKFLTPVLAKKIEEQWGTPIFVYSEDTFRQQAAKALAFPNMYGLKVRFAMKSSPNAAIVKLFSGLGICFDASSGYEVTRAMKAGVPACDISLSSQELPLNFKELIELGIDFNACSLNQFETFGKLFPGGSCGVRVNPGTGSGGNGKTVSALLIHQG